MSGVVGTVITLFMPQPPWSFYTSSYKPHVHLLLPFQLDFVFIVRTAKPIMARSTFLIPKNGAPGMSWPPLFDPRPMLR